MNEYLIETWRDGKANIFHIRRSVADAPFEINHRDSFDKTGSGTRIYGTLVKNHLPENVIQDLIGSKFVADPSFQIWINGKAIELTDLSHLFNEKVISIPGYGEVLVLMFDSRTPGRTMLQHGVAWWVNRRLVGEPSWKSLKGESYLDGRMSEAKRYTFVVQADILEDQVEDDWIGFKNTEKTQATIDVVEDFIVESLNSLLSDIRRSKKIAAIEENRARIGNLPTISRFQIGQFIDEIQKQSPSISPKELSDTVHVLAKLEHSRTGYSLVEQLANLTVDDLDKLSEILENWSIHDLGIVLTELERRLQVIAELEVLVAGKLVDELHEIQPLFDRGLWIFGPEYESIEFSSNRTLLTVFRSLFQDRESKPRTPRRRPDYVILEDSTIGLYARNGYDSRGEVNGIEKVLIIELKRGGFHVTVKEQRQAVDYALEIKRSGKVLPDAEIIGFVLGTSVDVDAQEPDSKGSQITVYARSYNAVLQQAHARTFNLYNKIKDAEWQRVADPEIELVINSPVQTDYLETMGIQ